MIYKLRGHDKSIVSLSWCPSPFSVFTDTDKCTVEKNGKTETLKFARNIIMGIMDDIFSDEAENEQHTVDTANDNKNAAKTDTVLPEPNKKKPNPWINLIHADDDEISPNYADHNVHDRELPIHDPDDFLNACAALKQQIIASKEDAPEQHTFDESTALDNEASNRNTSSGSVEEAIEVNVIVVSNKNDGEVVDVKPEECLKEEISCDNKLTEIDNAVSSECQKEVLHIKAKETIEQTPKTGCENVGVTECSKQFLLASSARGG